jgi:hypothetical protein
MAVVVDRALHTGTPPFQADSPRVDEHPVSYFWRLIDQLAPEHYPPGVVAVRQHHRGTAAFSAGAGLFRVGDDVLPPFPFGKVMFVAHNLNSEDTYRYWIDRDICPGEVMPYWRKTSCC